MNETVSDGYVAIGRRSIPRPVTDIPASGSYWSGPTQFIIQEEGPGAFRWVMISGDGRALQLAQSPTLFTTREECVQQVRKLNPQAAIQQGTPG